MANEVLVKQGTSVVWTSAGGNKVITLTSLANGAGREGAYNDFGATFPARVHVQVKLDFNVAPTVGNTVDIYFASSLDGSTFDGEVTGADAAYDDENSMRRLMFVGSLVCTADTDPQYQSWVFFLPSRYGTFIVSNQSGQALTATGTDQVLTATPLIDEVQ